MGDKSLQKVDFKLAKELVLSIECGDIIVYSRPTKETNSYYAYWLQHGARWTGLMQWDCLGVIIEDITTNQLYILEFSAEGFAFVPFTKEFLSLKTNNCLAVRKSMGFKDPSYKESLWKNVSEWVIPRKTNLDLVSKLFSTTILLLYNSVLLLVEDENTQFHRWNAFLNQEIKSQANLKDNSSSLYLDFLEQAKAKLNKFALDEEEKVDKQMKKIDSSPESAKFQSIFTGKPKDNPKKNIFDDDESLLNLCFSPELVVPNLQDVLITQEKAKLSLVFPLPTPDSLIDKHEDIYSISFHNGDMIPLSIFNNLITISQFQREYTIKIQGPLLIYAWINKELIVVGRLNEFHSSDMVIYYLKSLQYQYGALFFQAHQSASLSLCYSPLTSSHKSLSQSQTFKEQKRLVEVARCYHDLITLHYIWSIVSNNINLSLEKTSAIQETEKSHKETSSQIQVFPAKKSNISIDRIQLMEEFLVYLQSLARPTNSLNSAALIKGFDALLSDETFEELLRLHQQEQQFSEMTYSKNIFFAKLFALLCKYEISLKTCDAQPIIDSLAVYFHETKYRNSLEYKSNVIHILKEYKQMSRHNKDFYSVKSSQLIGLVPFFILPYSLSTFFTSSFRKIYDTCSPLWKNYRSKGAQNYSYQSNYSNQIGSYLNSMSIRFLTSPKNKHFSSRYLPKLTRSKLYSLGLLGSTLLYYQIYNKH